MNTKFIIFSNLSINLQDLEERMGHLVGDVLIAAAFMSYMGPFLSTYREEITLKWMAEVRWWHIEMQGSQLMSSTLCDRGVN